MIRYAVLAAREPLWIATADSKDKKSNLRMFKKSIMIRLLPVQPTDRDLLWNINQKYLYEMTKFYPDAMDEAGNLHYGHFEEYFTDPKRSVYFIYNDTVLVGFAMLCPYSNLGRTSDYTMAEFTIFPSYRRRHFALEAARQILETHPGQWEIKYNEKNLAGKGLWHTVTAPFAPEVCHLNDEETVLVFATPKRGSGEVDGQTQSLAETRRQRFSLRGFG